MKQISAFENVAKPAMGKDTTISMERAGSDSSMFLRRDLAGELSVAYAFAGVLAENEMPNIAVRQKIGSAIESVLVIIL